MKSTIFTSLWKVSFFTLLLMACQQEIELANNNIEEVPGNMVTTLAGKDSSDIVDGDFSTALFKRPNYLTIDAAGNVYVTDKSSPRIRKITPNGLVTTIAGSKKGFADGNGIKARFSSPSGMAVDSRGNIYIVDLENNRIRKLSSEGDVSTIAGDSTVGSSDGNGHTAQFNLPNGIAVDPEGNLYVADESNHLIRKITPQREVSTIAGKKKKGFADGQGADARFNDPIDLAIDGSGNIYVADRDNHRIRKITPNGMVSTIAGSDSAGYADGNGANARFNLPRGLTVDRQGNVYVADSENHCIRKITTDGVVSTIAGNGTAGFADGLGTAAQFSDPRGIVIDKEERNIYIADQDNHRVRKIALR